MAKSLAIKKKYWNTYYRRKEVNKVSNRIKLLTIEEVAVSVGVSVQTINIWYRWKKQNPEHERAKMLPDFIQAKQRQVRFWEPQDVMKLIEFKNSVTTGRNGIMGTVTQKYVKKEKN